MSKDDVSLKIELSESTQNQARSQGNPASSARPATGSDGPQPVAPGGSNKNPSPDTDGDAFPGSQQVEVNTDSGRGSGDGSGASPITDAHRRPAPYNAEFADPTVETETGETEEGLVAAGAAAEGAASALLPLAVAVGATVKIFDILSDTAHALDNSFQDMIRRGSQWNAQIGVAAEIGELKLMFAEMERANKLAAPLSDYANSRSDLSVEIKKMGTAVSERLLPLATEAVQALTGLAKIVNNTSQNIPDKEQLKALMKLFPQTAIYVHIMELLRDINNNTKKDQADELQGFDSQWQRFLTPHLMTSSVQPASKF